VNPLLDDMMWRGLIKNHTDLVELGNRLDHGPITLYCGYDPTADSLHVGNLQMVVMLRHFQLAGHRIIALSGGGTGLIGDPSGRSEERQLRGEQTVKGWTKSITDQLNRCLSITDDLIPPLFVDNIEWIAKMSAVDFLRDLGKHFTVNYMLAKDSVSSRIGNEDSGLSFTEFSYMLLQAFDFLTLYRQHGCELQIGGSDQWGNITAGITLTKKISGNSVYGITSPLILRSDGKKFGKSESGAIWLAREKTSPFAMHQYFMNVPDSDALMLLKRLTLLDRKFIEEIEQHTQTFPEKRLAQKTVAEEVVRFVHGADAVNEATAVSNWLFGTGNLPSNKNPNYSSLLAGVPCYETISSMKKTWDEFLTESGITTSKSDARRLIQGGGICVWENRIKKHDDLVDLPTISKDGIVVISKGKKNKTIIKVIESISS